MFRLLALSFFIVTGTLTFAQSKNLDETIYDWEYYKSSEEINQKISQLKEADGDENLILTLESIAALKRKDQLTRIEILIRLSKQNEGKNNYYSVYSNYHVASSLSLYNIPYFALEYADKAINACKQQNNQRILYLSYKIKGGIYFKLKSFEKARQSFLDASKSSGQCDIVEKASDNNNLALCYFELKQYHKAIGTYHSGLKKLDKEKKDQSEIYFLIIGNIGSAYTKLGDFDKGKKYLTEEINYYRSVNAISDNYSSSLIQIIELEERENNTIQMRLLGKELFNLINKNDVLDTRLRAIEFLVAASKRNSLGIEETKLNVLHNRILIDQLTRQEKLHGGLTNFLYEEKVKTIINNTHNETNAALESKKNERWKFIIVLGICIVFVAIMIYGYIILRKRIIKNQKEIHEKAKIEDTIRNQQLKLEKEMESQQQQLNILLTNLKIKQQTESGFLEKIKELKKNKNASTEQVIQELQMGLANLFDIDKKLIKEKAVETDIDLEHLNKFKATHSELTELELEMCSYFVADLTAKEIGLLLKISDVSVRVAKNKIKNKLGLAKETNLNTYLQSLL